MAKRGRPSRQDMAARAASEADVAASQVEAVSVSEPDNGSVEPSVPVSRRPQDLPHSRMMSELIEARRSQPDADEPAVEDDESDAVEPVAQAPATPEHKPAPSPVEPETVTVKIDGQEMQVAKAEVEEYGGVRAYQIAKAQEKQLKEAKEANAKLQQALAMVQQQLQRPAEPPKPQKSHEEVIKEKITAIQFGSQEEAARAWIELQELNKQPQIDQNAVITQAVEHMQMMQAAKRFDTENADIVKNPYFARLASMIVQEKVSREGKPRDWDTFMDGIARELRTNLGLAATTPQPTQPTIAAPQAVDATTTPQQTTAGSDRDARKASVTVLPTSAARAATPAEEEPKSYDEARRAALKNMRKARGQHYQ